MTNMPVYDTKLCTYNYHDCIAMVTHQREEVDDEAGLSAQCKERSTTVVLVQLEHFTILSRRGRRRRKEGGRRRRGRRGEGR